MGSNQLAALTLAGVLERAGRPRVVLRASPRFLAHAEGTGNRLRLQGLPADQHSVLATALRTWDDYRQDAAEGAHFLIRFLAERDHALPFRTLEVFTPHAIAA